MDGLADRRRDVDPVVLAGLERLEDGAAQRPAEFCALER